MAVGCEVNKQFLPKCPEGEFKTEVTGKLPVLTTVKVEPLGRWYEAFVHRRVHNHTLSHHSGFGTTSEDEDEDDLLDEDEEDDHELLSLDPKEWKNQDHYAVLGLKTMRYRATEEQIKAAYKRKVLKHHPDKRRARGAKVKDGDDDYFTCITRAIETLGNPQKRRSYDSVDPEFDDDIPNATPEAKEKDTFYELFAPVFERNARWSVKKKVPLLGNDNASYEDVNHFYSIWYDFDSWREYSYLDEEEKEKGENRDERRWIEKQNKAARQKRKKEEVSRIRQLVDNAYSCDPRIQRFKDEEKQRKLAQKKAKQDAARARVEEEERKKREAEEAEKKKREEEEERERKLAEAAKKEREAQKRAFKKERKTFRNTIKEMDYFASTDNEKIDTMMEVDKLAELLSLTSLQEINKVLTSGDKTKAQEAFSEQLKEVNAKILEDRRKNIEAAHKKEPSTPEEGGSSTSVPWLEAELQTLVKGVKTFPAGTVNRWETVANFITQHVPESNRTAKEVLNKAKELQKGEASQRLKQDVNQRAYDKFEQQHKSAKAADKSAPSQRLESVGEQQITQTGSNPAPWAAEEQKLLEQALKTYPANTPERWDRIAETIPTRSKKDCMKRYKELAELVKAKKAATAAAAAKSKK